MAFDHHLDVQRLCSGPGGLVEGVDLVRRIDADRLIAEALPWEKVALVARLQETSKVMAMVGDSVNDAATLAQADPALAMGTETDVAIEASELTLRPGRPPHDRRRKPAPDGRWARSRAICSGLRLQRRAISRGGWAARPSARGHGDGVLLGLRRHQRDPSFAPPKPSRGPAAAVSKQLICMRASAL